MINGQIIEFNDVKRVECLNYKCDSSSFLLKLMKFNEVVVLLSLRQI